MDKHLYKDIGEQFSEEMNLLSQQPSERIWENIDKELDKTGAKNYKEKSKQLKKRTLLLLLLLFGISTFSVIYFNTSKSKNKQPNLMKQKKEAAITNNTNNHPGNKQNSPLPNSFKQQRIADNTTFPATALLTAKEKLSVSEETFPERKGKTKITITASIAENELPQPVVFQTTKDKVPGISVTTTGIERTEIPELIGKNIPLTYQLSKNDTLPATLSNQLEKNNTKNLHKNNSRFTLTVFAAPDYSKYRLANDKHNSYDNKTGIATRERSDLSSSVGILLQYNTNEKITIQSGIIYSSSNISIGPTKIYAEKNNAGTIAFRYNTSSGYGYLLPSFSASPVAGDSLFADGANHTLRYISIPVIAKYKIGDKKLTFSPGIGFTFNFLEKATVTTDVVDQLNREAEYIAKLKGIKKFSPGLILNPEIQHQLSGNFSISVLFYFKYSLGPINKGNVVKTYPYTAGLGLGGMYKF